MFSDVQISSDFQSGRQRKPRLFGDVLQNMKNAVDVEFYSVAAGARFEMDIRSAFRHRRAYCLIGSWAAVSPPFAAFADGA